MNPLFRNSEGYPDVTAGKAIKAADKPPDNITWFIKCVRSIADIFDLEIVGRITLKDKKTGRLWK